MFYIWLVITIVFGIVEALTVNLVSIWFVISGILAMITSMITDNLYIQIGVFVIVGILLMPISKKIYKKIKKEKVSTNIDRIIGMKAVVTEDITKDNIGEVKVDGKRWSAYAKEDFKKGEVVKVMSISSVKLYVERWND